MSRSRIMGVLNVTPDSFSDGGLYTNIDAALEQAKLMISQGANIIDVGGESTRPGATRVTTEQEQERVIPIIEAIAKLGTRVSIDTMNSETAAAAIAAGAAIINDVSGGKNDPKIFEVAAKTNSKIIISHWRGHSTEMDSLTNYRDVVEDVILELGAQVEAANAAGVLRPQVVIDPGLGFAKTTEQNWEVISRLGEIQKLFIPILLGASRKRFISATLPEGADNDTKDAATAALTALTAKHKLWGYRVHNVAATRAALAIAETIRQN